MNLNDIKLTSKLVEVDFLGYTKCNYRETMYLADTYPKVTYSALKSQTYSNTALVISRRFDSVFSVCFGEKQLCKYLCHNRTVSLAQPPQPSLPRVINLLTLIRYLLISI